MHQYVFIHLLLLTATSAAGATILWVGVSVDGVVFAAANNNTYNQ